MNTGKEILKKVYTAKSKSELMEAYNNWAEEYDKDLDEFGYKAPAETVEYFVKYVNKGTRIIDVGCGTGLVGELLTARGFGNIDGLDYSENMLEVAKTKNIYKELIHADLSKKLNLSNNLYDALICVGTFTYGHVQKEAFESLAQIVKPGGHIIFTVREGAYDDLCYRDKMVEMEVRKIWELKEMVDAVYFTDDNISCKICVYENKTMSKII